MKTGIKLNKELIKSLDSVFNRNWANLRKDIDISRSTFYRLKDDPTGIDMKQLLAIANGLHIPVSNFFYEGSVLSIGKANDYVARPFIQCRYEYEKLRGIIAGRNNITWVKGVEYTGITEDNLKKSLLQEEAPVERLLDFCNGFGIDPFTVIVDPNPKERQKRGKKADDSTLLAEVAAMRRDIDSLAATASSLADKYQDMSAKYDEMLEKYATMLAEHKMLLRRFDEQEACLSGIAAEQ